MAARLVEGCLEEAKNARDVAAALDRFVEQVYECSAEITGAISELFAIASACGKLGPTINSSRYSRRVYLIESDLRLALSSLSISLVDIAKKFQRLAITPTPNSASYRRVWREMRFMFREEGSASLIGRLELYRTFLLELSLKLEGLLPGPVDMDILRSQIRIIRDYQERTLDLSFRGLSLAQQGAGLPIPVRPRRMSSERPQAVRAATAPAGRQWGPYSPPPMPPAPEIPLTVPVSPTSAYSSTSSGSSNSSPHWATRVFDGKYPETRLKASGQGSKCLGLNMTTLGLSRHDSEVVDMSFDGDLNVRLVWNRRDNRANMVCYSGFSASAPPSFQSIQLLSALKITRAGPCIHLLRSGTTHLWANLKFKIYERMTLFFCTFTALRAYGPADPMTEQSEFQLAGEIERYGGKIEDDGYLHALRMFKDMDSGAVRLQASVLNGEYGLKHTPIWTAFITKHVGSRSWLKRVRTKVIRLKELHQYIFSHDYAPQRGDRGEFELNFRSSQDAMDFENAFSKL